MTAALLLCLFGATTDGSAAAEPSSGSMDCREVSGGETSHEGQHRCPQSGAEASRQTSAPAKERVAAFREGVRFGMAGGATSAYFEVPYAGVAVGPFLNYSFGPTTEFRIGPQFAGMASVEGGAAFVAAVPMSFRVNLCSVYSMWLGIDLASVSLTRMYFTRVDGTGRTYSSRESGTQVLLGVELSPLTVRFGAKREYELSAAAGIEGALWAPPGASGLWVLQAALMLSRLFL